MRPLRLSVLALALLAGACGDAGTSSPSNSAREGATPSATDVASVKPEAPPIVGDPEPPLPKKEPTAPKKKEPPPTKQKEPAAPKENKEDAIRRDLQQLRGTWIAVDIQHDGQKENPTGGLKWVIQDEKYENWVGNKKMETWKLTIDPTKRPKTIGAAFVGGSRRLTGIYEVDGDNLKVCYDITGNGHPKDFTAPQGARRIVYIFRRR